MDGQVRLAQEQLAILEQLSKDKALAIKQWEASLRFDPQNAKAAARLKESISGGVDKADPAELEYAIKESYKILKPSGKVMLGAPLDKTTEDTTTFAHQLDWAREAGYVIEWQKKAETGSPVTGVATVSGLAVLRKG